MKSKCGFLCGKTRHVDPDEVDPQRTSIRWRFDAEDSSKTNNQKGDFGDTCWLCERTYAVHYSHDKQRDRKALQTEMATNLATLQEFLGHRKGRSDKARAAFNNRVPRSIMHLRISILPCPRIDAACLQAHSASLHRRVGQIVQGTRRWACTIKSIRTSG